MKKHFLNIVLSLMLLGLLVACGNQPPETADSGPDEAEVEEIEEAEEVEPTAEVEVEPDPTPTETASEPTEETTENEVVEEVDEEADDSDESMGDSTAMAADGPTHEAALTVAEAAIERPYDHAKGSDTPVVTIIEYGDFQ